MPQRTSQRITRIMEKRRPNPLIPDEIEDELLVLCVLGLIASLFLSAVARHWMPDRYNLLIGAATIFLTWLTTIGASRAAAHGTHVRIVYLADLLPDEPRWRVELFADAVLLLATLGLFAVSCVLIRYSLVHPAPRGHPLVYAAMPAGTALMAYRLCQRLLRDWKSWREHIP